MYLYARNEFCKLAHGTCGKVFLSEIQLVCHAVCEYRMYAGIKQKHLCVIPRRGVAVAHRGNVRFYFVGYAVGKLTQLRYLFFCGFKALCGSFAKLLCSLFDRFRAALPFLAGRTRDLYRNAEFHVTIAFPSLIRLSRNIFRALLYPCARACRGGCQRRPCICACRRKVFCCSPHRPCNIRQHKRQAPFRLLSTVHRRM